MVTGIALLCWTIEAPALATAALCVAAAAVQGFRLWRWKGWSTRSEPIVAILHVAYLFIPLGLLAIAGAKLGWSSEVSSLHLFTVGAIGAMTLAVMTRATLGHTGRSVVASASMCVAYVAITIAAIVRPAADLVPDLYLTVVAASALLWIAAFAAFLLGCAKMLVGPRVRT